MYSKLSYFDYCLSLIIYFPSSAYQSINNCFNLCLYKLFKFKPEKFEIDGVKYRNLIKAYGLRIFIVVNGLIVQNNLPSGHTVVESN